MMPWNGALKIFGLPTLRSMLSTDLVLITDNILFDRAFFNPAFNYLSTISLIAPYCRQRKIPAVLYNASVGPITTDIGKKALQKVLDAGPVAILRDARSREHLQELGLRCPEFVEGADCALNTRQPLSEEVDRILQRLYGGRDLRPMIGLNINAYLGSWQGRHDRGGSSRLTTVLADTVNRLTSEVEADVLIFVTQVMDHTISKELKIRLRESADIPVVANPDYTYQEIAGLLCRVELLVGMRTHAQILAVSAGTPVVNINSYPKSRAFLETLDMGQWSIDVAELTDARLDALIRRAWEVRADTRAHLLPAVLREQHKAKAAVTKIGDLLGFTPCRAK